jgi:type VI protein secretion system component Hcp
MKPQFPPAARTLRRLITEAAAIVAVLAPAMPCAAAPDVFMKLDGAETWSELAGAASEVKAPTAAEPVVTPGVRISKRSDSASPRLLQACGDGSVINRVTLAWRNAAGCVFRITLGNARVRSFRTAVGQGTLPLPMEECALSFATIEWSWFGHHGEDILIGGQTTHFDVPAQQATEKTVLPFRASLERVAGRRMVRLTCSVERARSYRISASTSLDGRWQKLEDFTASEDGNVERTMAESAGRLFLRVEALD